MKTRRNKINLINKVSCLRLLSICVILFSSLISLSQKTEENYYIKRSLKQEGLQFQFTVLDDEKKGVKKYDASKFYSWYKAQHVITTQGASSGILLNGMFEAYYPNKQLAQKGEYKKGLKNGNWEYWRVDGTLIKKENWKAGKLTRLQTNYNKNGEAIETIDLKYFKTIKNTNDSIIINNSITNKQKISLLNDSGELVKKEKLKKNKLHGKTKFYSNGKVVEVKKFKNGEEIIKIEPVKVEEIEGDDAIEEKENLDEESKSNENEPIEETEEKEPFFKHLFKKKDKKEIVE